MWSILTNKSEIRNGRIGPTADSTVVESAMLGLSCRLLIVCQDRMHFTESKSLSSLGATCCAMPGRSRRAANAINIDR